jgi:plasmid stability protein
MEEEVREILRDATKVEESGRKGLGTRISSRFRKIGLRKSKEIPELRDIQNQLQVPDFDE